MGTWGTGSFDNDTAADWAYELEDAEDLAPVEAALDAVHGEGDYLDADVAAIGLAAAEVVAALRGHAAPDLPENVRAWLAGHPLPVPDALLAETRRAVDTILARSELRDLWDESDEADAWRAAVGDLRARLR